MTTSRHIGRVTLLLVALSSALLQLALDDRQPGSGAPLLVASVVLAAGLHALLGRGTAGAWTGRSVVALVALGGLAFGWEGVSRSLFASGQPLEVQMACCLRNLMLGLAALQRLPKARSLAALSSLFLVVIGFLWSANAWTIGLLIAYAAVGMWWLVGTYWDRLGGRFADEIEPSAPVRPVVAAAVVIGLVSLAFAPLVARAPGTTALLGFFPSSGGTQWSSPYAYGGIGDGPQMVAAKENASSFGPVESELFLESKMPSLYDAMNEFSKAAPRKRKSSRRAIPLAPSMVQLNHQKKGTTQQATREFSTVRQATRRRSNPGDRKSPALLLVSGRTPTHLALETYDRWDGRSLIAAQQPAPHRFKLREPDQLGRRWLKFAAAPPRDTYPADAETQVRVVNLRTNRVPTPPNATAVTLEKLHAASMFSSADDGSLAMPVEHIPQLTIFRLRSTLRDRSAEPRLALAAADDSWSVAGKLAAEWTAGVPPGWPQVAAVLKRLRTDYVHDQEAMAPDTAGDAVEHFLLEAKRGPDYLFAASAAVMLRTLGYEARVRSGLYASPERYDRATRLTAVLAEDVHFWVEVKLAPGTAAAATSASGAGAGGVDAASVGADAAGVASWVTIEPTPGYDVLYAPESLLAAFARHGRQVLGVVAAHPGSSLLLCVLTCALVLARRQLADAGLSALWPVGAWLRGPQQLPCFTLRLLEWRAWARGQGRPAGTPIGRWPPLAGHDDFLSAAGWALYGQGTRSPLGDDAIRAACRGAIRIPLSSQPPRVGGPAEARQPEARRPEARRPEARHAARHRQTTPHAPDDHRR
ncbi:MAG: transglutaminase-like domain-containing protein [Planctomycetota bacterium]